MKSPTVAMPRANASCSAVCSASGLMRGHQQAPSGGSIGAGKAASSRREDRMGILCSESAGGRLSVKSFLVSSASQIYRQRETSRDDG